MLRGAERYPHRDRNLTLERNKFHQPTPSSWGLSNRSKDLSELDTTASDEFILRKRCLPYSR